MVKENNYKIQIGLLKLSIYSYNIFRQYIFIECDEIIFQTPTEG